MTDVLIDARRGAGSSLEILYGTVTWKPTLTHSRGTSIVLPAPTTYDLVDGQVVATNVQPSPAPVGGQVEWAYEVTFKDRHGKTFSFLVGVPDSTSQVNFIDLPRYFETKPPLFGQGPQGVPGESATVAVGTVTGGTAAQVNNSGTNTDAVLDFVLPKGDKGDPGAGVPAGGSALQIIRKNAGNTTTEWASLTKALVGLGNVDNTSDASKPVSTSQKTYIDQSNTLGYSSKLASDLPNTYPEGVTVALFRIQDGWPEAVAGASFTVIKTDVPRQFAMATQWAYAYKPSEALVATDTPTMYRQGFGALGWGEWQTVASQRWVDSKILNTPYLYGAIGDGVADDTGAITAWLDSANPNKHLDRGTFKVNGVTTAQSNINVIGVGGKLLGAITNSIMLSFTGNNVNVQGIEVDGGGIARGGIYLSGNSPTIKDCHVHHTYTTNSLAYGVSLQNLTQGYSVIGNRIHNIRSVGNTTQGDSDGASRAIYVTTANSTVTGETVRRGLISQNIIADVDGEEGDAIQVIIMPNYGSAKVDITGNTINGFSRRGIKLQAGDCVVKDNILYSNATANNYSYAITGIDSQYAANNVIQGNTIDLIGFPGAITAVGGTDTTSRASRVIIEGNTVRGGGITSRYLLQAVIKGNTVHYSSSYGVYVQASLASVVENNSLYLTGIATDSVAIYVGISCDRSVIKGNLLMEGSPTRIVSVSSPNCVIESNHSLALNNSYYDGNGPSSTGSLYAGNSAQSTALPFTGYAASQRHRGFDNTRAGSYVPNMFYTTTDPTTNGRNHTKGDIYFDFSPQAVSGGYAGWICTVGGNPGTFSRWGLIA